jgi:predicted aminopeptidase
MTSFNDLDYDSRAAVLAAVEKKYVFKWIRNIGLGVAAVAVSLLAGCPAYNVYSQQQSGRAKLAEAQSSRQVAVLEARAKMESAKSLAEAEVLRASGAAKANHILQNSLGGPEGYLRYLQIQALETTKSGLIYVPTEGGLPITEATRLARHSAPEEKR